MKQSLSDAIVYLFIPNIVLPLLVLEGREGTSLSLARVLASSCFSTSFIGGDQPSLPSSSCRPYLFLKGTNISDVQEAHNILLYNESRWRRDCRSAKKHV